MTLSRRFFFGLSAAALPASTAVAPSDAVHRAGTRPANATEVARFYNAQLKRLQALLTAFPVTAFEWTVDGSIVFVPESGWTAPGWEFLAKSDERSEERRLMVEPIVSSLPADDWRRINDALRRWKA